MAVLTDEELDGMEKKTREQLDYLVHIHGLTEASGKKVYIDLKSKLNRILDLKRERAKADK